VRRDGDAVFAAAVALISLAAAAVVLKLWNADLGAPFTYTGDGTLNLFFIESVLENAWYFENSRVGAPHGLELYDYPVINGETLNLMLFRVFGLATDNPALVMNLFFLLAFSLTALTSFIVLRRLSVSRGSALAVSVLYAMLPYHFTRGEAHVFLVAYYAVPLGAYLAIAVFRGDPLFAGRRAMLITAVMCTVVATASGSGYYAVFTVFLVVVAAALRFVVRRERESLVAGGAVIAAITAVSLLQLAPTIVYRVVNGKNEEAAQRFWFESENYSLRLTNLLLPVEGHRIEALARMKQEYVDNVPQTEARAAALGVVASIGFIWLVGVAIAAAAGAGRRYDLGFHVGLGVLTLVAVLVATTGGFSTFIAAAWPQIRAWNRISVFIAFFALAAVALLLSRLERRLPPLASAVVLAALVGVGVFDQTTQASAPPYEALKVAWREDASFYSALEDRLPAGAMVVHLPYEPFPEPEPRPLDPYEPAKAYLHTDDLRWSWGAMRGRAGDWAASNTSRPAPELVAAARDTGFAGILLDRLASGTEADAVQSELQQALGAAPVVSEGGRWAFFRL
jgi:phosphoglycerol transferase